MGCIMVNYDNFDLFFVAQRTTMIYPFEFVYDYLSCPIETKVDIWRPWDVQHVIFGTYAWAKHMVALFGGRPIKISIDQKGNPECPHKFLLDSYTTKYMNELCSEMEETCKHTT